MNIIYLVGFLFGVGLSFIEPHYQRTHFDGVIIEVKKNYVIINSNFEKLYLSSKDNNYEIGDILSIDGKYEEIDFVHLESEFDFTNYMNNKNVYYQINPDKIKVNFSNPIKINALKNYLLSFLDEQSRNIVSSLLFSNYVDNDISSSLKELHLSRLMSIGGLYISGFIYIISYFLKKKFNERKTDKVVIIFLLPLLILNISKFVMRKIFIYKILIYLNDYKFKDKLNRISLISILAIAFLLLDPSLGKQDSFILSIFVPLFIHLSMNYFAMFRRIKKKVIILFTLYLFFIPFELKYYASINLTAPIINLLLSPLLIGYGFISYILLFFPLLAFINSGLTQLVDNIINFFLFFKIEIYAPPLNSIGYIFYYSLLIIFIYYASIKFNMIKKRLKVVAVSFYLLYFLPINGLLNKGVYFINVGQGDACLIKNRSSAILIDTGGLTNKDVANDVLIPFFKKKQIYDIDLLITTHDDYDHSGAAGPLMKNFKVKRYYKDSDRFPLSIKGLKLINYNTSYLSSDDENDHSLVIGFNFINYDFLITGDASKNVEKRIMNEYSKINCDILKVGHHGSNTSTSEEFISYLSPKEAIISCGKKNKYHHPHQEVIDILNKHHILIHRTDLEGTISYTSLL